MNDKSLLSRYHQGDVYIVKDKKPTPGTTGEHPYLVISNDGAEVIYTVPISSAYTDYLPIHSRDKEGNVCYTYLNPFKMYPITCSQMDAHAVFAYRVSPEYLDLVIELFMSRIIRDDKAMDKMTAYRNEFFKKYSNIPTYHESVRKTRESKGVLIITQKDEHKKETKPIPTAANDIAKRIKDKYKAGKAIRFIRSTTPKEDVLKDSMFKDVDVDSLFHKKIDSYTMPEIFAFVSCVSQHGIQKTAEVFNIHPTTVSNRYRNIGTMLNQTK